jgi:hypothetical protein
MKTLLILLGVTMLSACGPHKTEIQKYKEYKAYCEEHSGILTVTPMVTDRGNAYKQISCTIDNIEFKLN